MGMHSNHSRFLASLGMTVHFLAYKVTRDSVNESHNTYRNDIVCTMP